MSSCWKILSMDLDESDELCIFGVEIDFWI